MIYMEVTFGIYPRTEITKDTLIGLAGDIGFESFIEDIFGVKAYIPLKHYNPDTIQELIKNFPIPDVAIAYEAHEQEDKDWNEEWEKNFFKPIIIDNRCIIHSTFHEDIPKMEYDILINPQMAFGTGHHETTNLIVSQLLNTDLKGKSLLDMGCGTSILAILASKRGANPITAIDIDEWCISNSRDNIKLNKITNITVKIGDSSLLQNEKPDFDIVIANINRNVLLADMSTYAACMHKGSIIFLSGFYVTDIPVIKESLKASGLVFEEYHENNKWAVVKAYK